MCVCVRLKCGIHIENRNLKSCLLYFALLRLQHLVHLDICLFEAKEVANRKTENEVVEREAQQLEPTKKPYLTTQEKIQPVERTKIQEECVKQEQQIEDEKEGKHRN